MTEPADRVDAIAVDGRRGRGAAFEEIGIKWAFVIMTPDRFAGRRVEAADDIRIVFIAHREKSSIGDGD